MNKENIFDKLDSDAPESERRRLLYDYLINQLSRQKEKPEDSEVIAYEIAGLLSTTLATAMDEDDPLLQVLYMAGQLELPEHQRGNANWEMLERLIEQLPQ